MPKKLQLVRPDSHVTSGHPAPPRPLGTAGGALWAAINAEYALDDGAGREMLCLACQSLDRAEACRVAIDADGEILKSKAGWRDHPLLRHEIAARSFTVRTLSKLGLDSEPIRAMGRPPLGM